MVAEGIVFRKPQDPAETASWNELDVLRLDDAAAAAEAEARGAYGALTLPTVYNGPRNCLHLMSVLTLTSCAASFSWRPLVAPGD